MLKNKKQRFSRSKNSNHYKSKSIPKSAPLIMTKRHFITTFRLPRPQIVLNNCINNQITATPTNGLNLLNQHQSTLKIINKHYLYTKQHYSFSTQDQRPKQLGLERKWQSLMHDIFEDRPKGDFVGMHDGHKFYEWCENPGPELDPFNLPKRYIDYRDKVPVPDQIHQLWDLWLRHARFDPPGEEEIAQFDLRRAKYHEKISISEARDQKLRLEEQLQRKLANDLNPNGNIGVGGGYKVGRDKDPLQSVQEFVQEMEAELTNQHKMRQERNEMYTPSTGEEYEQRKPTDPIETTWDPSKSRKWDDF